MKNQELRKKESWKIHDRASSNVAQFPHEIFTSEHHVDISSESELETDVEWIDKLVAFPYVFNALYDAHEQSENVALKEKIETSIAK